jgi:hypothetical protein
MSSRENSVYPGCEAFEASSRCASTVGPGLPGDKRPNWVLSPSSLGQFGASVRMTWCDPAAIGTMALQGRAVAERVA